MAAKAKDKQLMYKGKPLVRSGNTLYYGDLAGPYVTLLQCLDQEDFSDMKLPTRISIQLLSTDEDLPPVKRIINRAEKNNFYDAINIANIWLERILEDGD